MYVFVVALAPTHINTIETPSNQKLGPEVATNFELQKLHHVLIYVYLSHFFVSFDLVPPDIEPFSFGDLSIRTLSGTRTRVICGLTRGDLPVTFHWLKDGIPLHHHYSLLLRANTPDSEPVEPTISSVDLFSSLLTINKLTQGECS